jgi:hypothetical protein
VTPTRVVEVTGPTEGEAGVYMWSVAGPLLAVGVLVLVAGILGCWCVSRREKRVGHPGGAGGAAWQLFGKGPQLTESVLPQSQSISQSQSQSVRLHFLYVQECMHACVALGVCVFTQPVCFVLAVYIHSFFYPQGPCAL